MINTPATFSAMSLACKRHAALLFKELSFEIHPGELLLIEGENGSGKSSLLKILTGLAVPHQGDVFWNGISIKKNREVFFENLHFVGHANGLRMELSVGENLGFLVDENIFNLLKLSDYKNRLVKELSAGQRRKVALARLMAIRKPLWILDEPLTALDAGMQEVVVGLIENHLRNEGMVVMTSHQPVGWRDSKVKVVSLGEKLNTCDAG